MSTEMMTMTVGNTAGAPFILPDFRGKAIETHKGCAGPSKKDGAFAYALTQAERSSGHVNAEGKEPSPLSKEELLHILQEKQTEMNLRLLRILSDGANEYESPPDVLRSLLQGDPERPSNSEVSRYQQQGPKSDGSLPSRDWEPIIRQASEQYGVDPDLIRAVIKVESNFQAASTSPKGAMGLMQLMPGTALDMGVTDAYDPVQNIMGGTRYLKRLLNRYRGDIPQALAAYNWGAGNLEKYPDRLPRETRDYISRVTHHYETAKGDA